jgi:hypothetical protein
VLVFPNAYAAALLGRDDAGQTVFFPEGKRERGYIVPDVESELRISRQLKKIRLAQLAAWALLPVAFVAFLILTDSILIPKWLFVSGFLTIAAAVQLAPEWARRRLTRGLVAEVEPSPESSLLERLPGWAAILLMVLAVCLALYLGRVWPVTALAWFDDVSHIRPALKAFTEITVTMGAVAAMIWGGFGALRRWLGDHKDAPDPTGTDAKQ